MDDFDKDIFEESDEETDVLTASEVLKRLEEAWVTEKMSPNLQRHQSQLVDCMLDQINQMTENLKRCKKSDFRLSIHKMEIDRIRYIISSYLRIRLEKIEKFAHYLLDQERQSSDLDHSVLSADEIKFAREHSSSLESHLKSLALKNMPENLQAFDIAKMSIKPNLDSYVFLRVKQSTAGVLIPDETGEGRDEEVDFEEGGQHIVRYKAIQNLLDSNAVTLM